MERQVLGNLRQEIKFQISTDKFASIFNLCLENGFQEEYPIRSVQSIYFDDHFNSMLHDSMNGLLERKKIRLRWYNKEVVGQLEVKIKSNNINDKVITPVKKLPKTSSYRELLYFIRKQILDQNLFPVSKVTYSRIYLLNKKSNVRITLDYNISTIDIQTNIFNNLNDSFILEVKAPINSILPNLHIGSLTRFSKYCFSRLEKT